eukprot:CAMPEP_0194025816 /NCGR_PEP_ID=MMETSP0009_2-20130614/74_1 /TAXON_ID=210454 /ORGANISM="Grammatophora oceanica, Strain CCMP 410" /LENGTH=100 /DNA_ID=CAMNT_0038664139 /DNA_START=53 /DNA_END=355 /DNA_ORIENTATION=-
MKSVIATFLALLAYAAAFVPQHAAKTAFSVATKSGIPSTAVAMMVEPSSIVEALPSTTLAMEVQFGAYLAVALGTLLPCLFLINLYISTETRKAGAEGDI